MKPKNILKLIVAIAVSELAGIIGSIFTAPSIPTWYATLAKPSFNPPSWVFAPVWTTLFALMGIAAYLVWRKGLDRRDVKIALGIFLGQLILNTLWSFIFFGQHNPGRAFAEIIFLWLAILATIIAFAKISKPAAWLLFPYILWVSFAGFLNFSIWQLYKTPPIDNFSNSIISLPQGYTLDHYSIEKVMPVPCDAGYECVTPPEYMLRSSCPYTSICLNHKCAVVCPSYKNR